MSAASIFGALGSLGEQYGRARTELRGENLQAQQLAAQMRRQNALDQIAKQRLDLQMKEYEAKLSKDKRERSIVIKGPRGESVLFDPFAPNGENVISTPDIPKGFEIAGSPEEKLATYKREAAKLAPEDERGRQQLEKVILGFTEPKEPAEKAVAIKSVGDVPWEITDENGKSWNVHDPSLPAPLRAKVDSYQEAARKSSEEKAVIEARKNAEMLNRAMQLADLHEYQKEYNTFFNTVKRGIDGHGFLKTINDQVAVARNSPSQAGSSPGDRLIAESFMQLSFNLDPKALRGSPNMVQMNLKGQGGWDDLAIAEINKAINGGGMSQAVREAMLARAREQTRGWDVQVRTTSQMLDPSNKRAKALGDRYDQIVAGDPNLATPKEVADKLRALGGKPQ